MLARLLLIARDFFEYSRLDPRRRDTTLRLDVGFSILWQTSHTLRRHLPGKPDALEQSVLSSEPIRDNQCRK